MSKTLHVLIVDDDPVICRLLTKALTKEGHAAMSVRLGKECLSILKRHPFDVLLLDFFLPDMGGLEALRLIRQENPHLNVIAMSGLGSMRNGLGMLELDAIDFLVKPINLTFLFDLIRKVQKKPVVFSSKSSRMAGLPVSDTLVGESKAMKRVIETIEKVAQSNSNVLLEGETGSGKDLVARQIHKQSERKNGPFVAINCSALPDSLLESELFGFEKGAFTGAHERKRGLFESANHGTLFLDEIGEISPFLQSKLLRVVDTKRFRRLGETSEREVNVRIVCATNRKLLKESRAKKFRLDLFYRLSVISISLPPLRDRKEDIALLVRHFINTLTRVGQTLHDVPVDVMQCLEGYTWPGNVRELFNVVEHMLVFSGGKKISVDVLPSHIRPLSTQVPSFNDEFRLVHPSQSIQRIEKEHIKAVLKHVDGHRNRAAQVLGISNRALYYKLKKYNIA